MNLQGCIDVVFKLSLHFSPPTVQLWKRSVKTKQEEVEFLDWVGLFGGNRMVSLNIISWLCDMLPFIAGGTDSDKVHAQSFITKRRVAVMSINVANEACWNGVEKNFKYFNYHCLTSVMFSLTPSHNSYEQTPVTDTEDMITPGI